MESEKFNKQILEALRQMQPQQPANMTERFMKRLREEGLPAQPKSKSQRFVRLITISAVAAAAAVLCLVFLPLEKGIKVSTTQPQITQAKAAQQPKQHAEQMQPVSTKETALPASNKSAPLQQPQRKELMTHAKPVQSSLSTLQQKAQTGKEIAPTEAKPASPSAIAVSSVPSVATEFHPLPEFTAEERALMERAEEMRPQATIYAAEILQCARIESCERQRDILHQQENPCHEPKAINI